MSLEHLITTYGYVVLLIGTFFEGETVLVLAGFLAHRGYLELPWVVLVAFIGTFASDQLFFFIGRTKGTAFLEKRPVWKAKSARALSLLHRRQTWVILGFRFIYGLRTVTPFLIGMSRVGPLRFLVLNALGAISWASVVGLLGYFIGQSLELFLAEVKKYEIWVITVIALVGLLVWLVSRVRNRRLKVP